MSGSYLCLEKLNFAPEIRLFRRAMFWETRELWGTSKSEILRRSPFPTLREISPIRNFIVLF